MSNIRTVQFSCPVFGGWRCRVDLDLCDSLEDIVKLAVGQLDTWIQSLKTEQPDLYGLETSFRALRESFESHCSSFEEILLGEPSDIVYVCCTHAPVH